MVCFVYGGPSSAQGAVNCLKPCQGHAETIVGVVQGTQHTGARGPQPERGAVRRGQGTGDWKGQTEASAAKPGLTQ